MDLYEACVANDHSQVRDILANGTASVNFSNSTDDNKTSLHVAAEQQNAEIVQLLIRQGANVHAVDRAGLTPFGRVCLAVGMGNSSQNETGVTCIRLLAQFDSPTLTLDQFGNSVIHVLAAKGTPAGFMLVCHELAQILTNRRTPTKSSGCRTEGLTVIDKQFLEIADNVWSLNYTVALLLLPGWGFLTPLHLVADAGNTALLVMMLRFMKEKDQLFCQPLDAIGWTPLHWAAMRNHKNCISTLVRYGGRKICSHTDFMSRAPVDVCFSFAHQTTAAWMLRRFVKEASDTTLSHENLSTRKKTSHHFALAAAALVLSLTAGAEASLRVVLLLASSKALLALVLSFLLPPFAWWLLTTRAVWKGMLLCVTKIGALKAAHYKLPHRWHDVRTMGRSVLNQHNDDGQPCAVRADLRRDWHAIWTEIHEWKNDPLVCVFLWWLQAHILSCKVPSKATPAQSLLQVGRHLSSHQEYSSDDSSYSDDSEDPTHIIEILQRSRTCSAESISSESEAESSEVSLTSSDEDTANAVSITLTGTSDSSALSSSNVGSSSSGELESSNPIPAVASVTTPAVLRSRLKEMLVGGLMLRKGVQRLPPSPPPVSQMQKYIATTTSESGTESMEESSSRDAMSSNVITSLGASHESSGPWAPSWLPGSNTANPVVAASYAETTTNESNTGHGGEFRKANGGAYMHELANSSASWWRVLSSVASTAQVDGDAHKPWKQTPHFGSSWTGGALEHARAPVTVRNPLMRQLADRWLSETHLAEGFKIWRREFVSVCNLINEVPHLFCRIPNVVGCEGASRSWGGESFAEVLRSRNPAVPEKEIALAGALPLTLKSSANTTQLSSVIDLIRAESCLQSNYAKAQPLDGGKAPFTDIDVCHWKLRPLQDHQPLLVNVWLPCILDIAVALIVICLSEYPRDFVGIVRILYIKAFVLSLLAIEVVTVLAWTLLYKSDSQILCPTPEIGS